MRRKDRQICAKEDIYAILDKAEALFLALEAGDYPYCLPVNFAREGAAIYVHSALSGTKLDCIRQNSHIAFSTAIDIQIDTANFTTYYKSVCGTGNAVIIEDEREKGHALDLLAARYKALCPVPAPLANIRRVAVIRIDILEITGKMNLPPDSPQK